jgi:dTDP-4-dehydrorhamnose 3,5-epimerase
MPAQIESLDISDVKVVRSSKLIDDRGFFSEVYNRRDLAEAGVSVEFVRDNHSLSLEPGTVRGMHFQIPPFAQHKLVRVVRGAITDVVVDIREGSPTYGRNVSVTLSANDWNQIFVPIGFAHGFMTLQPNTEVLYKVSNYYSPQHDRGLLWNDEDLAIQWPRMENVVISDKDKSWPRLRDVPRVFSWPNLQ